MIFLSEDAKAKLVYQMREGYGLSKKQIECALLAMQGMTQVEIKEKLGLSLSAVKHRFSMIYRNLKIKNKAQIIWRLEPLKSFSKSKNIDVGKKGVSIDKKVILQKENNESHVDLPIGVEQGFL